MSQGRSIFQTIITNFINSLRPRNLRGQLRGRDQYGTEYYEGEKNLHTKRNRRWLVSVQGNEPPEEIPAEWEAWLKHKRRDPPTEEEIQINAQKMFTVIENARRLEMAKSENAKKQGEQNIAVIGTEAKPKSLERSFPQYEEYSTDPYKSEEKNRSS